MKSLLLCLLVALTLSVAYGLKCYTCDSHDSDLKAGHCGDPFSFNETLLVECQDEDEIFCRKRKTGANHIWTKIERMCAAECETKNTAYVDRVDCCKTDGCNTGSVAKPVAVLLVGALSLLGLKKFL